MVGPFLDERNPHDVLITIPPSHYMEYNPKTQMYRNRISLRNKNGSVLGHNILQGRTLHFDVLKKRIGFAEQSSCSQEMPPLENNQESTYNDDNKDVTTNNIDQQTDNAGTINGGGVATNSNPSSTSSSPPPPPPPQLPQSPPSTTNSEESRTQSLDTPKTEYSDNTFNPPPPKTIKYTDPVKFVNFYYYAAIFLGVILIALFSLNLCRKYRKVASNETNVNKV